MTRRLKWSNTRTGLITGFRKNMKKEIIPKANINLKQGRFQNINKYTVELGRLWVKGYKKRLIGMIPCFINGLYDQQVKQRMEVWWADNKHKVNQFSIVILMAMQKDDKEGDDIVDFETVADLESPEPAVGEFGPRSKTFNQEDIKAVGEILRKIFDW